ncbi:hypothetical protein EVJ58_g2478 [Rhodofomes roseus]|uniref:Uncharacterized protein n=1 Tax=Rhodofomes roseus TaxID=34475 RepID=A0A4Y9YSB5_9APHY|nr:hypothetical protein EVJ58_g2478 [Rhodofomes roseus]
MQSDHRMHHYGGELYPQAARTSFKFLPSPRTLNIDAIGTHGSVRFMLDDRDYGQAEDAASKRYISVDVTAFSDDWLGFEQTAMLCQTVPRVTDAGEISEGVIISADTDRAAANGTVFDITVRFPAASDSPSLPPFSPKISATMFGFEILIDDMDNHVLFDSVFLRSMKKSIHINKALRANSVQVQNWNGNISGSITSKGQIDLYAHNGAVTINADLVADEASVTSTHSPGATTPTLLVTTVYGPIDATVNLLTARSLDVFREPGNGSLPTYKTILHTINAPLTVAYPIAPEHHNLTLFVSNSHAPTTARLPDSFVGHLALRSQNMQRPLVVHLDEKADRHRRRLQITSVDKHGLTATVQRGSLDSDRQLGAVRLLSSSMDTRIAVFHAAFLKRDVDSR